MANKHWKATMALLKILAQGEADVVARRTVNQKQAFTAAKAAIERIRKRKRG